MIISVLAFHAKHVSNGPGAESIVKYLELVRLHLRWVRNSTSATEREQFLPKNHDIICQPSRFNSRIESSH